MKVQLSCTESSIINVKSLLYNKLPQACVVSSGDFIVKKFVYGNDQFRQSHVLSHIWIVQWVSGSPDVTYFQPCFPGQDLLAILTMINTGQYKHRNQGPWHPQIIQLLHMGIRSFCNNKSTLACYAPWFPQT